MSYLNISKEIDMYLKKIKFSETRVKDIVNDRQLTSSTSTKNRENSWKGTKGVEFEFLKEYIKRKIKKNQSLDRIRSIDLSKKGHRSFEKSKEKCLLNEKQYSESENKSVQVDFLRPIFRFEDNLTEESEHDKKIGKIKVLPRVKSLTPSNNRAKTHSKPKNPSKFMNEYYKFHVKLKFPPKQSQRLRQISLDKNSSKRCLSDFKRVQLFNISE